MGDVYYIERHGRRIAVSVLNPITPDTPRSKRKRSGQFVLVPKAWLQKLSAMSIGTRWLAVALLWKSWCHYGRPFPCSNSLLKEFGLTRWHKDRGLVELEQAGLITVRRAQFRSPQITIN